LIKHSSSEKANLHHIGSKEKPHLHSIDKSSNKQGLPKQIYSICHKKNEEAISKPDETHSSPLKRQKNERIPQPKK
jgi:hypothetical protein